MRRISRGRVVFAVAAVGALALLPARAGAESISLMVNTDSSIQQVLNAPCVIGDPSCPDTFPYTLLGPQMDAATVSSPVYTAADIRTVTGSDTFAVGVDLNQAMGHDDGRYRLLAFTLAVNGTVMFSLPSPITLAPLNAGNGFSDALIQGFDLSGIAPDASLVFTATFAGATAGREQYFLQAVQGGDVTGAAPVPEPASILLVASGLVGAIAHRRRRRASRAS